VKKEELFRRLETPPRGPAGALRSPLSSYVLNELPADLTAVAQGRRTYGELAAKQSRILTALGPDGWPAGDPLSASVARLDLLFLLNGYFPAGPASFPRLLLDTIAAHRARFPSLDPHMSYELLIDVNCAEWERGGHIRVFSEGGLGRSERDFYLGHYLSEPAVRTAYERLAPLVLEPGGTDTAAALEQAVECLDDFRLHMAQYHRLTAEAFRSFRRYHAGDPDGPRGASGAFMPSVQLLELVLLAPTPRYEVYLDQCMAYFPRWSRPLITAWRARSRAGGNLVQAVLDGRLVLDHRAATALLRLLDRFTDFRMVHLGITRRTLPEAFALRGAPTRARILAQGGEEDILDTDEPGTSGFSARNVLTNAAYRLLTARRRLAGFLGPVTG
jgi:hypothetical protein